MKVEETFLKGCFIIAPRIFTDERGYFFESYNAKTFYDLTGQDVHFVQDNRSKSKRGTLRGLHFQIGESAQAKLVSVLKGEVLDIAVDIRRNSPTFGQHFGINLSEANNKQLYIPRGFAHGFVVLSEEAEFFYKCDNYYDKSAERGIFYADPELKIDWTMPADKLTLSDKDKQNKMLKEILSEI